MFTVTHWSWFGEVETELPDDPAEADEEAVVEVFTTGQCHAYALAVHELTGWPMVGSEWQCSCGECEYAYEPECVPCPNHVGCIADDGEVYDVCSFWPNPGHYFDWERDAQIDPEVVLGNFGTDSYLAPDMEVARVYAKHALTTEGLI